MVSLYFHIPFCTRKCDYCHFYVIPDKDPFKKILTEGFAYEWQRSLPLLEGQAIETVYFGGGTPSLYGPLSIKTIIDKIKQSCTLSQPSIEITLEANPEGITKELMTAYRQAGINRVSIGLQTLDDPLLKKIGRLHTAQKGIDSVIQTYEAGIENITVDLMYDLPDQTLFSWQHTLTTATQLPIKHLSLYNLTIEPYTTFYKYREQIQKQQPTDSESEKMYSLAVQHLNKHGLQQYEISAFAKNGYESHHNTGYWTARPFLGFGPSAYSYWNGKRFRNTANINKWHRALLNGEDPVDYSEQLNENAAKAELLAVQLRLLKGVSLSDFQTKQGKLPLEIERSIEKLSIEGFLIQSEGTLSLTKQGILFYDTVASELVIV